MLQQSAASLPPAKTIDDTCDKLIDDERDDAACGKKEASFDGTQTGSTCAPDDYDPTSSQATWSASTVSYVLGQQTTSLGIRMELIPPVTEEPEDISDDDHPQVTLRADAPVFSPTPGPPGLEVAAQKVSAVAPPAPPGLLGEQKGRCANRSVASGGPMYLPTNKKEHNDHFEGMEQPMKVEQDETEPQRRQQGQEQIDDTMSGQMSKDIDRELPSLGSSEHDGTGRCRPCAWFWKPQGCENGKECRHCHICPAGEIKARKNAKGASLRAASPEERTRLTQSEPVKRLAKPEWKGNRWHDDWASQGLAAYPPPFPFPPMLAAPIPPLFVEPLIDPVDPADLPSHGSVLHGVGRCKPCAWFWKSSGCQNGKDCCHCHICPDGEIKARKNVKVTAMRMGLLGSLPNLGAPWVQPFPNVSLDPLLTSY